MLSSDYNVLSSTLIALNNFIQCNHCKVTGPKPSFKVWREQKIFLGAEDYCFVIRLKQIFLDTTKFGWAQKKFRGALPTNATLPVATGLPSSATVSVNVPYNKNLYHNRI